MTTKLIISIVTVALVSACQTTIETKPVTSDLGPAALPSPLVGTKWVLLKDGKEVESKLIAINGDSKGFENSTLHFRVLFQVSPFPSPEYFQLCMLPILSGQISPSTFVILEVPVDPLQFSNSVAGAKRFLSRVYLHPSSANWIAATAAPIN